MLPAIPPAVGLGIAAAKIALPLIGKIGSNIGNRKRSAPNNSQMRINERGMPEYPERQTMEYRTTKSRKEVRQERRENRNRIVH